MRVLRLSRALTKVLTPLAWWSVIIGAVALIVMMLTTVIDVTLRTALSKVLPGSVELIGLTLIIVFFSACAYVEFKKEHIQADALVNRFSPGTQQIITTNGYFVTIGVFIIVGWQFFSRTLDIKAGNIVSAVLHVPWWPFFLAGSLFVALFVLALLVSFLEHLAELHTTKGIKAYPWLLPGIVVALGIFALAMQPSLLPFEVSRSTWGGAIMVLLFILIFLKVPIAAVMAVAALLGLSYLSGTAAGLGVLSMAVKEVAGGYTWSVMPLFLWMGTLAYYGGFAGEIYDTAHKWLGRLPGGLASASVSACTGLAALTGSSMTGVMAMGVLGLPQMKKYNYDMKLATASICAGATVGCLIPPSIPFIIYGMLTEVSIGKLLIAGILPGLLFSGILIAQITVMCLINPKLGPPGPRTSWKEKMLALKGIWAVALLILLLLAGLYTGVFTATEAGAIGCFGVILIAALRGRLTFKGFISSISEALRANSAVMLIFVFATAVCYFLAATNLPYDLAEWVVGLGLSKYGIIALIIVIYVILGCIMNSFPAIILTLPILFPIATAAGFDPVWFGVIIVVMCDLGAITPPIGMNVFAMSAVAKDVPMYDIFRGLLPFWLVFIILIVLLILFPQICLFLPNLMWT